MAAFTAIKHLGTNGGGFYGVNSAHPLENPNYFTAIIQMIAQTIIPMGLVFALGYMLKNKKFSRMIFGVMTVGFIILVTPTIISEMQGNPNITAMGIQQTMGNMEGKEIRFGSGLSGYWSILTTVISTGSVNAMHDSFMPLSTMISIIGYDGRWLLRWLWCRVSQLLYFYHFSRIYQRIDGRANTRIFRQKKLKRKK